MWIGCVSSWGAESGAPTNGARPGRGLSPEFQAGLDCLIEGLHPPAGLWDPLDLMKAVYLFNRFFDVGQSARPATIARYLEETYGWPRRAADQVGYTWEVVVALRNLQEISAVK